MFEMESVFAPWQPFYFDGKSYGSENCKPLRQLLFVKIQEDGFMELFEEENKLSPLVLLLKLRLKAADVELSEGVVSSERGNVDLIASAILADDQALFLSLLPKSNEAYFKGRARAVDTSHLSQRGGPLYLLSRHWVGHSWTKERDLIEDNFQRLHFEIFMSSVVRSVYPDRDTFGVRSEDDEKIAEVFSLLPESGPARNQVLAILGGLVKPESGLAQALVKQASTEGSELDETLVDLSYIAKRDRFDVFFYGWICALYGDDWSVLDFQFQYEAEELIADLLAECAFRQALYQVAGEPGTMKEVMARLANYGLKRTNPSAQAWFEIIALVGGAETSPWKENLKTLDAGPQQMARAEMAAQLQEILSSLKGMSFSKESKFQWRPRRNSTLSKPWIYPLARKRSERLLATIVEDELELFAAAEISIEDRLKLVLEAFDWQQLESCVEENTEGEAEKRLLTELALKGRPSASSRDDFLTFLESIASQNSPESQERSQLYFKAAMFQISHRNLQGAKEAIEKINAIHFEDYEIKRLQDQLRELEEAAEELREDLETAD